MSFGYKDNFHFRPITIEDEKKVRKIIFDVLEAYGLVVDVEGVDHDLFHITAYYEKGLFGVVEDQNTMDIVGSFALYPLSDKVIELRKMYLLPDYRRKGIGNWCVDFCEAFAQKLGYETICLESASVLKEALWLYEKKGYKRVEQENQVARCDVSMTKRLK